MLKELAFDPGRVGMEAERDDPDEHQKADRKERELPRQHKHEDDDDEAHESALELDRAINSCGVGKYFCQCQDVLHVELSKGPLKVNLLSFYGIERLQAYYLRPVDVVCNCIRDPLAQIVENSGAQPFA